MTIIYAIINIVHNIIYVYVRIYMLEIMELDVLVTPTHQSTNHWRHTSGLGPL